LVSRAWAFEVEREVAAPLELSKPEMEMVMYSYRVKHLPESCLGLYNFQSWSKERHLWGHGDLEESVKDSIRLFSSSLMDNTVTAYIHVSSLKVRVECFSSLMIGQLTLVNDTGTERQAKPSTQHIGLACGCPTFCFHYRDATGTLWGRGGWQPA
jgi:hypothetical protein